MNEQIERLTTILSAYIFSTAALNSESGNYIFYDSDFKQFSFYQNQYSLKDVNFRKNLKAKLYEYKGIIDVSMHYDELVQENYIDVTLYQDYCLKKIFG